ncbi:putative-like family protein [Aspergillus mulundensis]|uniref:Putative-like family protein n=1 Tax=Aspergillus mulundensis TaxID=1810919 RepID=A0A3D8SIE4_9EURO|nr:putative-like family protein [Aspergillus mulundensis]RDW86052.1 putative-like family protein [Aspergillus mulundensis]
MAREREQAHPVTFGNKMVKVAVAGGTGDVGRTIVEVLKDNPRHEAVVFTRRATGNLLGVPSVIVDYSDVNSLRHILEEQQIHTVISALGYDGDALSTAQLNLIRAADASSSTQRFAPSAFACAYTPDMIDTLPALDDYFRAVDELKSSSLQWTIFMNGYFMDYLAPGKIKSYLRPLPSVIDIENKIAAVPGNGDVPITFTYSFDAARFVVASLDAEEWPEESRMAGDVATWNSLVSLAEEISGSQFQVLRDDIEKLQRGEVTELPIHALAYEHMSKRAFQAFSAASSLWTQDPKIMHIAGEVNARFPEIQTLTVRRLFEKCWSASASH